jgi:hypothetical protein
MPNVSAIIIPNCLKHNLKERLSHVLNTETVLMTRCSSPRFTVVLTRTWRRKARVKHDFGQNFTGILKAVPILRSSVLPTCLYQPQNNFSGLHFILLLLFTIYAYKSIPSSITCLYKVYLYIVMPSSTIPASGLSNTSICRCSSV